MDMTKRAVKQALGIETDADLARYLGMKNRWAVGQWAADEPIPEGRQWQLRALRPELFPAPAKGEAA